MLLKIKSLTSTLPKFTTNESKVLKILLNNSRTTDTELAAHLKVSIQAARKIRKKLEKNIIKKYIIEFNYTSLGIKTLAIVILELEERDYNKAIQFLSPNLISLYRVQKNVRTHIALFAFYDIDELEEFFYNLHFNYFNVFKIKHIYPVSARGLIKNSESQLINNLINCILKNLDSSRRPSQVFPKEHYIQKLKLAKMNNNEKKVFGMLCLNSKICLNTLARELSLSPTAIKNIQQRLEEKEVITKYSIRVDYAKLGMNIFAFIILKEKSPLGYGIHDWVNKEPNIVSCYKTIDGSTDILFCIFRNINELDRYLHSFQTMNKEVIETENIYILPPKGIIYDSFNFQSRI